MTPVPKDIPLPLPAPEPLLVVVLVLFFLLHIVFVNLMLGGSLLTVWYQVKGLRDARYDHLAHAIAETITVNKSLAVVLGIGPLLAINTLYTVYFYSANALTGTMWLAIIPLVAGAFLLTYLHKFAWDAMAGWRRLHIAIAALASLAFLVIPLIFLTNINLMLFPSRWAEVRGFASAMLMANVLPRYAHFLLASLALTGLFLVWLFRRATDGRCAEIGMERHVLLRIGYGWALWPSLAQFLAGPLVMLTLPDEGMNGPVVATILAGALFAMPAIGLMFLDLRARPEAIGRRFWPVTLLLTVTVLCMASGRHLYRAAALAPHQAEVRLKTDAYMKQVRDAAERAGR